MHVNYSKLIADKIVGDHVSAYGPIPNVDALKRALEEAIAKTVRLESASWIVETEEP